MHTTHTDPYYGPTRLEGSRHKKPGSATPILPHLATLPTALQGHLGLRSRSRPIRLCFRLRSKDTWVYDPNLAPSGYASDCTPNT